MECKIGMRVAISLPKNEQRAEADVMYTESQNLVCMRFTEDSISDREYPSGGDGGLA